MFFTPGVPDESGAGGEQLLFQPSLHPFFPRSRAEREMKEQAVTAQFKAPDLD